MNRITIPFEGKHLSCIDLSNDSNKPYMIVLPGGPGMPASHYLSASEFFQQWSNIIIIDPPGCGESTGFEPETLNMEQYIRAISAVQDHLQQDKIQLFGTSYGAMLAFDYISRFPDKVSKAITIGGAPSYHFLDLAKRNLQRDGTPKQIAICNKILWPGAAKSVEEIHEFFNIMAARYSTSTAENETSDYAKVDCSMHALNNGFGSEFWHFDLTDRLADTQCDLLALWGEFDWVNDPSIAQIIQEHIPHAQTHVIKGSGHSVAKDATEEFQNLAKSFMAE